MKKIIFLAFLIVLLTGLPSYSDGDDIPTGDLWESYNKVNEEYKEPTAVSDEEFDKAVESLKKKKDPIGTWIKKHRTLKGDEHSQGNESEVLNNEVEPEQTTPVISLPVELQIGEGILPVGHYQVIGERKDNGTITLKLYQAQYLMAEIPATETNDDFGEDIICFAKWIEDGNNKIKLIYGSIDFNAYTFLNIAPVSTHYP